MRKNQVIHKVTALILLGCISLIVHNAFSNKHLHRLGDGTIIAHAHPYHPEKSPTPFQKHGHTSTELCFFSTTGSLDWLSTLAFIVPLVFLIPLINIPVLFKENKVFQIRFFHPSFRGPPLF